MENILKLIIAGSFVLTMSMLIAMLITYLTDRNNKFDFEFWKKFWITGSIW